MRRDWKPGDLAVGEINRWSGLLLRTESGWVDNAGERWADSEVHTSRPLVVIDPEDREQAAAVIAAFSDQFTSWSTAGERDAEKMQAALRSLVTPPKPEEPTGLGAVVEDADGRRWIRHSNTPGTWPWLAEGQGVEGWTKIAAVRVLSDGVQS